MSRYKLAGAATYHQNFPFAGTDNVYVVNSSGRTGNPTIRVVLTSVQVAERRYIGDRELVAQSETHARNNDEVLY